MTDREYERARDALIPQAERYAEARCNEILSTKDRKIRHPYHARIFLRRMQELAYECGLCSWRR